MPAPGCPIRRSAHQRVFAPTRGFSQLVTSFFASESQGILHVPFSPFLFLFKGNSPFYLLFFFFSIEVKNQRSRISAAVSLSLSATHGLPRRGGFRLCRQAYCLAHLRSLLASCVLYCLCCSCSLSFSTSPGALPLPAGKKTCFSFQYVNVLFFRVENNGFEPLTPCLQSRCSSQLS